MAEYTIKDLMAISKTTDRAIRQLFDDKKGNKELIRLKESHIIKRQNRVYYDEAIYNWFLEYYKDKNSPLVENSEPMGEFENEKAENPNITPAPIAPTEDIEASANAENEAIIADLRANIEALETELEKKGVIIEVLERENGNITQEKAAIEAELQAKEGIIEGMRQAYDSLKETNAALQGQLADLTDRIAAQGRELQNKTEQIERLIISNNALSITVNRAQQERLSAQAKKPRLLDRIKNRLLGRKPAIIAEETPEAVEVEPEADTKEAEEQ